MAPVRQLWKGGKRANDRKIWKRTTWPNWLGIVRLDRRHVVHFVENLRARWRPWQRIRFNGGSFKNGWMSESDRSAEGWKEHRKTVGRDGGADAVADVKGEKRGYRIHVFSFFFFILLFCLKNNYFIYRKIDLFHNRWNLYNVSVNSIFMNCRQIIKECSLKQGKIFFN